MTFDLTNDEANLIAAALAKQPYEVVANLLAKLQKQATEQTAAPAPAPAEPAKE